MPKNILNLGIKIEPDTAGTDAMVLVRLLIYLARGNQKYRYCCSSSNRDRLDFKAEIQIICWGQWALYFTLFGNWL